MRSSLRFLLCALGLTTGAACSSTTTTGSGTCTPGETQVCEGLGRCAGVQTCRDDGSGWASCLCADGAGGESGAAGSSGATTGGRATGGAETGGNATGGTNTGGGATGGNAGAPPTGTGGAAASGGTGAVAGTGGASPLGANCSAAADCQSGNCADGLCCETGCEGTCRTCGADGVCVMPEDDAACGTIECSPAADACTSVPSVLDSNRCAALGQCKDASDCPGTHAEARTGCVLASYEQSICDGVGSCLPPTISCEGSCVLSTRNCCWYEAGGFCKATVCNASETPVYCDEHADCVLGSLCGFSSFTGSPTVVKCSVADSVNWTISGPTYGGVGRELCASPVMTSTCSNGGACSLTFSTLPGLTFCQPTG